MVAGLMPRAEACDAATDSVPYGLAPAGYPDPGVPARPRSPPYAPVMDGMFYNPGTRETFKDYNAGFDILRAETIRHPRCVPRKNSQLAFCHVPFHISVERSSSDIPDKCHRFKKKPLRLANLRRISRLAMSSFPFWAVVEDEAKCSTHLHLVRRLQTDPRLGYPPPSCSDLRTGSVRMLRPTED
ncbi:unnamed protein product [Nesidiocoris tenuis]|uniref:Uncharacterized protein n=1 Tax=Nesidiocoris tenuis TaxID=355587 RepID=A0A6H5GWF3_9HEMI|nr:unnamed protein product [Nesidiocoris tenuis]